MKPLYRKPAQRSQQRLTPPARVVIPSAEGAEELAIIAVHYNPQRYCLPLRNYWEWRHSLGPLQRNLITVELSFDDHFSIYDSHKIRGAENQILWQKEAMINFAIRNLLPDECRYIAWIDHDLVFQQADWAPRAVAKLRDECDVLQLFQEWACYDESRNLAMSRNSYVARHVGGISTRTGPVAPGGAWAASREYLEKIGGLLDNNIVGGGDQGACDAWTHVSSEYLTRYSPELAENNRNWQARAQFAMNRGCSWLPCTVHHLYHGDRKFRGYWHRQTILSRNRFDPDRDIQLADNGLLEWSSDKPELHRDVAEYFATRREDG